ncbi:hypothetical protein JCM11641_002525 [Rhodosporidiobolus odoratus]
MQSVNNLVDQAKSTVGSYLSNDSSSCSTPASTAVSTSTPDAAESLGVNQLGTDRGDATFSGDIERESGPGNAGETGSGAVAYSASGRDNTGSFFGGANEDIPNLGAGEMPGRS